MRILTNAEIPQEKWNLLISGSPYASAFQTSAFYKLFNSIPGLSAEAIAIEDSYDIKAICVVTLQKENGLKGYFSRRAIIYGGPVLKNDEEIYLQYLLGSISNGFKRKSIYSEIRNLNDYSAFKRVFGINGWQYLPYQNFIVACSDKESLFKKLGNNRKRQIKRAISSGVVVKEAQNLNEINEFYSILKSLYTKRIKKPLLPKKFFEECYKKNLGKYLLVRYKDRIIGGILCTILEKRIIYEMYVCGQDEAFRDQNPSVMATWAAMEYANQNKIPLFDFMGAGHPNSKYGVRDFKARFGGKEVEYGRFLKVNNPILYALGKSFISIRQKIK